MEDFKYYNNYLQGLRGKWPQRLKNEEVFNLLNPYRLTILDETGIDILENTRKRQVVDLRRIFCYHSRYNLSEGLTYADIGDYLDKHHATIVHTVKQYSDLYRTDISFRAKANYFIFKFQTIDAVEDLYAYKRRLFDMVKGISEGDAAKVLNLIDKQDIQVESETLEPIENE